MTETLTVTGKGRKPGEVLAAQIERTLVTAIKNATAVEEVERLERYCKLGLLPQDMVLLLEEEQREADAALVIDMEKTGPLEPDPPDWGGEHEAKSEEVLGEGGVSSGSAAAGFAAGAEISSGPAAAGPGTVPATT